MRLGDSDLLEDLGAGSLPADDVSPDLLAKLRHHIGSAVHHLDLISLTLEILGQIRSTPATTNDYRQHGAPVAVKE
jgi:hypothetical protein